MSRGFTTGGTFSLTYLSITAYPNATETGVTPYQFTESGGVWSLTSGSLVSLEGGIRADGVGAVGVSDSLAVIGYRDAASPTAQPRCVVADVATAPLGVTLSAAADILAVPCDGPVRLVKNGAGKLLAAIRNSDIDNGLLIAGDASASGVSWGSAVNLPVGVGAADDYALATDGAGNFCAIVTPSGGDATAFFGSVDGSNAITLSPNSAALDWPGQDTVYIGNGQFGVANVDGDFYKAEESTGANPEGFPLGIARQGGGAGETIEVYTNGVVPRTGLSTGYTYYGQADGTLTSTPGSGPQIGHAVAGNKLLLDIKR